MENNRMVMSNNNFSTGNSNENNELEYAREAGNFRAPQQSNPLLPNNTMVRSPKKEVEYIESDRKMFSAPNSFMPFMPTSISYKRTRMPEEQAVEQNFKIKATENMPSDARERIYKKIIERMNQMQLRQTTIDDFLKNTSFDQGNGGYRQFSAPLGSLAYMPGMNYTRREPQRNRHNFQ